MKKSTGIRFMELFNSFRIINDSLDLIKKGKRYQVIPLSGQIRALLLDHKEKSQPLFLEIANLLTIDTDIYLLEKIGSPVKDGLIFSYEKPIISLEPKDSPYKKIKISDFLKIHIFKTDKKEFTIEETIKSFANKNGGAHYDKNIPDDKLELLTLKLERDPIVYNAIIDLAKVIHTLCLKIIKSENDFTYQFKIFINKNLATDTEDKNLFYFKEKTSPIGFALRLTTENKIQFIGSDLTENRVEFTTDNSIDTNIWNIITIMYEITDNLKTKISINLNNLKTYTYETDELIFIYNASYSYNVIFSDEKLELLLSQFLNYKIILTDEEVKNNFMSLSTLPNEGRLFKNRVLGTFENNGLKFN